MAILLFIMISSVQSALMTDSHHIGVPLCQIREIGVYINGQQQS
jgi:hypothetical protein